MSTDQRAAQMDLHVACLCNLAFACIKLGFLEETEEACSRALHITPANSKALFRRGQARLASGRPAEAASDFRAVAILEPTNVEVKKIICCVEEDDGSDARNIGPQRWGAGVVTEKQLSDCGGASLKACPSRFNVERHSTTRGGGDRTCVENNGVMTGVNSDGTVATIAGPAAATNGTREAHASRSGKMENKCKGREGADEQSKAGWASDMSPGRSGFMVPGWLSSQERENAAVQQRQLQQSGIHSLKEASPFTARTFFDTHQPNGEGASSRDGTDVNRDDTSRLVVKQKSLYAAKGPEPDVKNPAAVSEWLCLQEEEDKKIQRIFQQPVGGSQRKRELKKGNSGPPISGRVGNANGKKQVDTLIHENKQVLGAKALHMSEWASLEDQEKCVRDTFRARLRIGKNTEKKQTVSCLQAVPQKMDDAASRMAS